MSRADWSRNFISAVALDGLTAQVESQEQSFAWSDVDGISAGRAPVGEGASILVLAMEVHTGATRRVFLVAEVEPVWPALTEILPTVFAGVPTFAEWGPKVLTANAPFSLYDREGRPSSP